MNNRESIDGNEVESNPPKHYAIDSIVVQPVIYQANDINSLLPSTVHLTAQLNEKIVHAVDQSINVVLADINGYILYGNENVYNLTLYKPEEVLGKHTSLFNANYHSKEFFKNMWETILSGKIWRGDVKNRRKDGHIIWVRMNIVPLLDGSGSPYQFVALKEDITEKKEIEFRLAQKDKQLSALTNNSYDIVGIIDQPGKIIYQNPAFEHVLGFTPFETIGSNLIDFIDEKDVPTGRNMLERIIDNPNVPFWQQLRIKHKHETVRWCDVGFTNYLEDPYIQGIVFNLRDITKQKEATAIINKIANFDYLTNLPNRRHFENQLKDTLKNARTENRRVALLFLDLDGFKHINDSHGHEIGDGLLKLVGQRISLFFNDKAFVGRLGGDEFSIIIPNIPNYTYLKSLTDSLIQEFNRPFIVEDFKLNISASIGISIYPMAGTDLKTLLKNADVAMYQAKNDGKNQYQLYTPMTILD